MAATVPTTEPLTLTAGDTAEWTITLADYPSSTFTLSYALQLQGGGASISITATAAANGDHSVSVGADVTQTYAAGIYAWQKYVTGIATGKRYTLGAGQIEILPNFAGAGQIDPRSKARRILDFLEDSFEKVAKKQVVSATIEGVQLQFRTMKELQQARDYWLTQVNTEEAAAATAPQQRRCILAQFTTPV